MEVPGVIPLSKSVVVPVNTSLIVLTKLHVLFHGERVDTLQNEQTFDRESEVRYDEILCSNFHLQMFWSGQGFLDSSFITFKESHYWR